MVEKRKDRMKAQPYVSKIRTVFNDGSIFEGNEVQNALVCSFTAESRGGVKSSTVIEYDTAGFNAIKIRAGARVCFHPESGEESIIDRDLEVFDARWGVNGNSGWVFNYDNGQPWAYTLDVERCEEIP